MTVLKGRDATVRIGTYVVAEQGNWKLTLSAAEIDTTAFGSTWAKSEVGFKKWSISFNGFYDKTDTTGQDILKSSYMAGSLITTLRLYVDNTSYWIPDVTTDSSCGGRVTTYDIGHDKGNVASVSFTVSGSGPITFV